MAIVAFTGWPGHGKSYGVTKHVILENLKKGRTVVTNIPMKPVHCFAYLQACGVTGPMDLRIISMREWSDVVKGKRDIVDFCPPGAVVVLDEVSRLWSAGIRANEVSDNDKRFVQEHRHRVGPDGFSTEIVLVCQDLAQISNFVRLLVERTIVVHKLKEVGQPDRYRVEIYMGQRTAGTGGTLIQSAFGKYSSTVWTCYKSHTQSEVVGIEEESDRRGAIWSRGAVVVGLPLGAIAIGLGGYLLLGGLENTLDGGSAVASEAVETTQDSGARFSSQAFPVRSGISQDDKHLKESRRWRIVGTVVDEEGEGLVVLSDSNGTRYESIEHCSLMFESNLEYECEIDGELVASWTGAPDRSNVFASFAQEKTGE